MRNTAMNMVHKLAARDERVLYIGSDPGAGTLRAMSKEFPSRHLIEGISEAHVIGMSAGLAMEGYVPYVNTIATFLTRRCYEQVAVELCLHNLPVRLIANGGGLVYAPLGPTHQAIEDIAIMRALPNMTVVCPADADETTRLMEQTLDWPGPIYIRLAKGGDAIVSKAEHGFKIGKAILMRSPGDVLMVTTGILHMHTVKPLDIEAVLQAIRGVRLLVSLEEHVPTGGLGSAIAEGLIDRLRRGLPAMLRLSLPDAFMHNYGSQDSLMKKYDLAPAGIAASIQRAVAASGVSSSQLHSTGSTTDDPQLRRSILLSARAVFRSGADPGRDRTAGRDRRFYPRQAGCRIRKTFCRVDRDPPCDRCRLRHR